MPSVAQRPYTAQCVTVRRAELCHAAPSCATSRRTPCRAAPLCATPRRAAPRQSTQHGATQISAALLAGVLITDRCTATRVNVFPVIHRRDKQQHLSRFQLFMLYVLARIVRRSAARRGAALRGVATRCAACRCAARSCAALRGVAQRCAAWRDRACARHTS